MRLLINVLWSNGSLPSATVLSVTEEHHPRTPPKKRKNEEEKGKRRQAETLYKHVKQDTTAKK